jgi:hypothetical protein
MRAAPKSIDKRWQCNLLGIFPREMLSLYRGPGKQTRPLQDRAHPLIDLVTFRVFALWALIASTIMRIPPKNGICSHFCGLTVWLRIGAPNFALLVDQII